MTRKGRAKSVGAKPSKGTLSRTRVVRKDSKQQEPGIGRKIYRGAVNLGAAGASLAAGPGAGVAVEAGGAAGEYIYDYFANSKGNRKVSNMPSGTLSGKIRGSAYTVSRKGGLTKYGMAQKGITYREEFRLQDATGANEARLIGHTSLPIKATYYNIFRALLKTLFNRAGINIDALSAPTGLSATNQIQILVSYYSDWTTTNVTTQTFTPANASSTWVAIMDEFADFMKGQFVEDPRSIRWLNLELRPPSTYNVLSPQRVRLSLAQTKFVIHSKSALKFQNQSGTWVTATADVEEDDVTNVPVQCNMYYIVGNQFINQNRKVSATVGLGDLGFSNTYQKNDVGAEAQPAYEVLNCVGRTKVTMDPGHIKTSIISYSKTLYFGEILRMLMRKDLSILTGGWLFNDTQYIKSAGHSRAIHIDRVIGSATADTGVMVRLATEVELTQQVACLTKFDYSTDQYEVQRP
jgi:hypothetical protein